MGRSIYDISQEFEDIFELVEAADGVIDDELAERLAVNRDDFEQKVGQIALFQLSLESDLANIKAEKDRLDKLKKRKEKTIESLEILLIRAVSKYGKPKVTDGGKTNHSVVLPTMKVATSVKDVVELIDIDSCPDDLKKIDITIKMPFASLTEDVREKLTEVGGTQEKTVVLDRVLALKLGKQKDYIRTGFDVVESISLQIK